MSSKSLQAASISAQHQHRYFFAGNNGLPPSGHTAELCERQEKCEREKRRMNRHVYINDASFN